MESSSIRSVALLGFPASSLLLLRATLGERITIVLEADDPRAAATLAPDVVVICHGDSFRGSTAISPAELRKRFFCWNPVIVFNRFPHSGEDDELWNIHRLFPPLNIVRLQALVDRVTPFSTERQQEVLTGTLFQVREDLLTLYKLSTGMQHADDDRLRQDVAAMVKMVQGSPAQNEPILAQFIATAAEFLARPTFDIVALETLMTLVVATEDRARELKLDVLGGKLHSLNGLVRLAVNNSKLPSKWRSDLLQQLPISQIERFFPGIGQPLTTIAQQLQQEESDAIPSGVNSTELLKYAALISQALTPKQSSSSFAIKRIVVVEDDQGWQQLILAVLYSLGLSMEIETAGTVEEAERKLTSGKDGILALVDLGLPKNSEDAQKGLLDLDGGLKLLKTFTGDDRIRPIVLTATENFASCVIEAMATGIIAADYIQKDFYWEEQLRSRVELAVRQFHRPHIPKVDIYNFTGRIIRVDGVEIILEPKHFALLRYLAVFARKPREVAMICDNFLYQEGDEINTVNIHDYVYNIKQTVGSAFNSLGITKTYDDLISHVSHYNGYCLQADARIIEDSREISAPYTLRKVLVVEDSNEWSRNLQSHLKSLGFDVQYAQTVEDAKHIIDDWMPHYVTLDLQLPNTQADLRENIVDEENGLTILSYLRERLPDAEIVVLTSIAYKDTSLMLKLFRAGVSPLNYYGKHWENVLGKVAQSLWRQAIKRERGSMITLSDTPTHVSHIIINQQTENIIIDDCPVQLNGRQKSIFLILAQTPNMYVHKLRLMTLYPPVDPESDDFDILNKKRNDIFYTDIKRLRKAIHDQTHGHVDGKQMIITAEMICKVTGMVTFT